MQIIKYLVIFFWLEAILVLSTGCTAPKQRRGDWMEHLNYRQFSSRPLSIQWDRHNYYSLEELQQMWKATYNEAMADLDKRLADLENEDIHKRPNK